jgi:hypothetical protein
MGHRSVERPPFSARLAANDYLHDGAVIDAAGVLARGGELDEWSPACASVGTGKRHSHFHGLVARQRAVVGWGPRRPAVGVKVSKEAEGFFFYFFLPLAPRLRTTK